MLKHGSLFSGIGGFDLAAQWMGWENVFHCEWNDFGQRLLKYYWPNATSYEDIIKTDFTNHQGEIDILTGGFPCQPYSNSGKRLGTADDRHLWPHMLRAIREVQPGWVLAENVRGLVSWNEGVVFDQIQADLEAEGYQVTPYLVPACSLNAPHRRDRIWFVAYSNLYANKSNRKGVKTKGVGSENLTQQKGGPERSSQPTGCSSVQRNDSHTNGYRWEEQGESRQSIGEEKAKAWKASWSIDENTWPTQSPVCCGNDGLSDRLDGITFPRWRGESVKGYGNAVVPQIVLQFFKAIEEYELSVLHRRAA